MALAGRRNNGGRANNGVRRPPSKRMDILAGIDEQQVVGGGGQPPCSCCCCIEQPATGSGQLEPETCGPQCPKCRIVERWTRAQAGLVAEAGGRRFRSSPAKPRDANYSSDRNNNNNNNQRWRPAQELSRISALASGSGSNSHGSARHQDDDAVSSLTEGPSSHSSASSSSSSSSSGLSSAGSPPDPGRWVARQPRAPSLRRSKVTARQGVAIRQLMAPSLSRRRQAPAPPAIDCDVAGEGATTLASVPDAGSGKPTILSDSEVYSMEHCLRSLKSSIYVCGCLANLYLTETELVDNGRHSRPTPDGWRLNKTGVPVLSFDSGLTRNRNKRRLSIHLMERGSGFVLWSDIIDHLSSYRAFSLRLHGNQREPPTQQDDLCDSFHVMYLSTNHRLMVGLSFDDPKCARLFLEQVELVAADPANISLTGPKLGHQLGRLGRLLTRRRDEPATVARSTTKLHSLVPRRRLLEPAKPGPAGQLEFSWSTLKRAIRFGHQVRARQVGSSTTSEALLPRPLAELAMAGKSYRAGRRLPRKCDISAPCLFQHVTRVALDNLEELHSSCLIGGPGTRELPPPPPFKVPPNGTTLISGGVRPAAPANTAVETPTVGSGSLSTSSCYSSGSSRKFDSDASQPSAAAKSSSREARWAQPTGTPLAKSRPQATGRPPTVRPKPPLVPQRVDSNPRPAECPPAPPAPPTSGDGKIRAIIRELETQTSAELVEAKRKLMADIASQFSKNRIRETAQSPTSGLVSHL